MLVLSRQKNQRIRFPGLGVVVEILEVKGSKVRVGIDAPIEVRVLRDELEDHGEPNAPNLQTVKLPQALRHDLRNALHELSLMLHVYRKRSEQDTTDAISPEQMFEAIIERLERLSSHDVLTPRGVLNATPAPISNTASDAAVVGDALIVDDDDNERELLAGFLRMCNYKVHTASDGLQGVKHLQTNDPPRVILLDMNMPRCNGREFLRAVRQVSVWDPIHVFVISGNTPEEVRLGPKDGYTHWFNKPLDPRRVVEALAKIETPDATVA